MRKLSTKHQTWLIHECLYPLTPRVKPLFFNFTQFGILENLSILNLVTSGRANCCIVNDSKTKHICGFTIDNHQFLLKQNALFSSREGTGSLVGSFFSRFWSRPQARNNMYFETEICRDQLLICQYEVFIEISHNIQVNLKKN